MRICLLGLDNLPLLAPEYPARTIGGESVQQVLLGRAFAQRGHEVHMVVADVGQPDGWVQDGIRLWKAYRFDAGLPVVRFVHPRWTSVWAALARADCDVYYTSCAGMHVGLLAFFCQSRGKPFVYRVASDAECEPRLTRIRLARDRWLYRYGRSHAHTVLVQSVEQARALELNSGLQGRVASMLVEKPDRPPEARDIDVLWIANLLEVKRPDRIIELARAMPKKRFHIAGGKLACSAELYETTKRAAAALPNVTFHGYLPYKQANALYRRARVFVNTSDLEGFPNAYLQAWASGTPVVTAIDPDNVIRRERLGTWIVDWRRLPEAVSALLDDPAKLEATSARCRDYIEREYGDDMILAPYLEVLETARASGTRPVTALSSLS